MQIQHYGLDTFTNMKAFKKMLQQKTLFEMAHAFGVCVRKNGRQFMSNTGLMLVMNYHPEVFDQIPTILSIGGIEAFMGYLNQEFDLDEFPLSEDIPDLIKALHEISEDFLDLLSKEVDKGDIPENFLDYAAMFEFLVDIAVSERGDLPNGIPWLWESLYTILITCAKYPNSKLYGVVFNLYAKSNLLWFEHGRSFLIHEFLLKLLREADRHWKIIFELLLDLADHRYQEGNLHTRAFYLRILPQGYVLKKHNLEVGKFILGRTDLITDNPKTLVSACLSLYGERLTYRDKLYIALAENKVKTIVKYYEENKDDSRKIIIEKYKGDYSKIFKYIK